MTESEIFQEFITKRLGCVIIYHPENKGFVYFKINKDHCLIHELYISEDHRGDGVARFLMDTVCKYAKIHDCKHVAITVIFNTDTAEQALAAALHDKFKVAQIFEREGKIYLLKEI